MTDGEVDFEANPELLVQPKYAARSAAYFLVANRLPEIADQGETEVQVNAITAVVNKHTDSYEERTKNFETIQKNGWLK
ncbi:hypothetical protein [Pandoraea bronchicola]|uniref:hypothetical protein n=1 Tax=Pandoraea bronchicola TaxID=2508287 RepID=UPI0015843304|nr:hypothetical protein [Pandoraea bronchicola]